MMQFNATTHFGLTAESETELLNGENWENKMIIIMWLRRGLVWLGVELYYLDLESPSFDGVLDSN